MNVEDINGSQFCMNCKYIGERGCCKHPKAKNTWATNQRNGCDFFDGELVQIDWNKATPIGYRPSTFSREG